MNDIAKKKSQLPVTPADDDPYSAYGRAVGSDTPFLKFHKGEYRYGSDGEVLPLGTKLVPHMAELRAGFLKWKNGEPVDEVMVRISEGKSLPQREDMDDQDKNAWELDANGTPIDPWGHTNTLPFKDPKTGIEFVFTTRSIGGIKAIGKLASAFGSQRHKHGDKLPIVTIGSGSYKHPIYGEVHVPALKITGWLGEAELIAGKPEELNDDIPF